MTLRWVCLLLAVFIINGCMIYPGGSTYYKVKPSIILSPLTNPQGNYYISYMYTGLKLEECFMPECNDNFIDELEKIWYKLFEIPPDDSDIYTRY